MNVENNENSVNEDHSLKETLNRVKLEEQIMHVEGTVALYKVCLR